MGGGGFIPAGVILQFGLNPRPMPYSLGVKNISAPSRVSYQARPPSQNKKRFFIKPNA